METKNTFSTNKKRNPIHFKDSKEITFDNLRHAWAFSTQFLKTSLDIEDIRYKVYFKHLLNRANPLPSLMYSAEEKAAKTVKLKEWWSHSNGAAYYLLLAITE